MQLLNDIRPECSAYYIGFLILKSLDNVNECPLEVLFQKVNNLQQVSFGKAMLALEWLFCAETIDYIFKEKTIYVFKISSNH